MNRKEQGLLEVAPWTVLLSSAMGTLSSSRFPLTEKTKEPKPNQTGEKGSGPTGEEAGEGKAMLGQPQLQASPPALSPNHTPDTAAVLRGGGGWDSPSSMSPPPPLPP
uniref:Uncharacterized protein n=1 Tax=Knipowitschia caucasica TaxID=637954 RepID=A0AAV2MAE9_KNICA